MGKIRRIGKKLKGSSESLKRKPAAKLKRRRRRRISKKKQLRSFIILLAVFLFAFEVAIFMMREHYELYPGAFERDSVHLKDRGTDFIDLTWNPVRNVRRYNVYYKEYIKEAERAKAESRGVPVGELIPDNSWKKRSVSGNNIKLKGLKEGSQYSFIVRADSSKRKGKYSQSLIFSTKRTQTLNVDERIMKFTVSKPFKIKADAETELVFKSGNKSVADVDKKTGKIVIKGPGTAEIKVEAKETEGIAAESEVVELEVLDSVQVPAGGAKAVDIYHLNSDNCEVVKEVSGADGHVVPQSFGYTGDKYIIAYGMSGQGRIVIYPVDGDGEEGKQVIAPSIALSHPNGFTYADENRTCYSAKGWTSRVVTYEPASGDFGALNLRYGCSGIGYDRKEKKLYTSSRTLMVSYDISDGYSVANTCGVVSHSQTMSTQDIGGYGGIMLRCLSPSGNIHGINYIDLYDMRNGTYLGSLTCDLSEVESAIVNDDGYLEILANNTSGTDYIWRTPINVATLAEGLGD